MIGSKRVAGLEGEIAALRAALDDQAARAGVADVRTVERDARSEVLAATLAEVTARLDVIEAELGRLAATGQEAVQLSQTFAADQATRRAIEQAVAKLEKRIEAQAEEMRVTATALLQRMAGQTIAR